MSKSGTPVSNQILLLGAFPPEVDQLIHLNGLSLSVDPHHSASVRVEDLQILEVGITGIGNLNAALFLQSKILLEKDSRISEVIFIGSAGVYGELPGMKEGDRDDLATLQTMTGASVLFCNLEWAVLTGVAHQPDAIAGTVSTCSGAYGAYLSQFLNAKMGIANSPDSITLADPFAVVAGDCSPVFENMEVFGLASVCSKYSIPFTALFALTNFVSPMGSRQWQDSHERLSQQLQTRIQHVLVASGLGSMPDELNS